MFEVGWTETWWDPVEKPRLKTSIPFDISLISIPGTQLTLVLIGISALFWGVGSLQK